jgi:thiosulfate dehydrogenase [quinone] large subunit
MTENFALNRAEPVSTESSRLGTATQRLGLPLGLCLVQLVLAYEWLVSGINKLLNPNFTVQLASTLRQNMNGNPYSWYVSFLRQIVLPHATLFGVLTELGELAIGITLVVSTVLWWRRPHGRLTLYVGGAACLALAGAVLLPLNFFFMSGSPLPWINPANAFNEGMTIDMLVPLLSVALLVANLRAVRAVAGRLSELRAAGDGRLSWAS